MHRFYMRMLLLWIDFIIILDVRRQCRLVEKKHDRTKEISVEKDEYKCEWCHSDAKALTHSGGRDCVMTSQLLL